MLVSFIEHTGCCWWLPISDLELAYIPSAQHFRAGEDSLPAGSLEVIEYHFNYAPSFDLFFMPVLQESRRPSDLRDFCSLIVSVPQTRELMPFRGNDGLRIVLTRDLISIQVLVYSLQRPVGSIT